MAADRIVVRNWHGAGATAIAVTPASAPYLMVSSIFWKRPA
jgi:hypothetical protein